MNKNDTEALEASQEGPRPGWREDGNVDIDAVRAGTPDLADAPAILESLCDEVEGLRRGGASNDRALLRAVLDALDVPDADPHIDWQRERREVIERRAKDVRIGLRGYLDGAAPAGTTLDWVLQSAVDYPATYRTSVGA